MASIGNSSAVSRRPVNDSTGSGGSSVAHASASGFPPPEMRQMRSSVSRRAASGKNCITFAPTARSACVQNIRSAAALNSEISPSASNTMIASIAEPTISEKRASDS